MSKLDRLLKTKAVTRLVPETRPFRLDPAGAREAVLLLHGWTGNPRELAPLGQALAGSGRACLAPRLPGHGTDCADFNASGAEDWLRRAIDSYLDLRAEYETVHVAGHSMGGLLAAIVAAVFNPPRLILLTPAFKVHNPAFAVAPFLAPFLPVLRRDRPLPDTETDPVRRKLYPEYWANELIGGAAQLGRLLRAARRDIARVHSRILTVVGSEDKVVPPSVESYVRESARGASSFDSVEVRGGTHHLPFDASAAETSRIVLEWLDR